MKSYRPSTRVWGLMLILGATSAAQVVSAQSAVPSFDLSALIECKKQIKDYGQLASFLSSEPSSPKALGWKELKSSNPLLKEYQLASPVTVFGQSASKIAFGSSGILAVLDNTSPQALARTLKLEKMIDTPEKAMFFRVVQEKKDAGIAEKITLNVSTVDSHPKQTLAGCDYRVEVE